jgi:hypothetical protein
VKISYGGCHDQTKREELQPTLQIAATPGSPGQTPPIPWWKRPIPVILTLGTVAAAITAILALIQPLLPKHSPLNVARFVSVQALSQVPLSEFHQRSTISTQSADHPPIQGPRLIVAVSGQALIQDSTPTAAPAPTSTATPGGVT